MYLADKMRLIRDGLSSADRKAFPRGFVEFKSKLAETILDKAELFAFNPSALLMAGGLKIDAPGELHRVLYTVLSGPPRKFWLEADGEIRAKALNPVRNTLIRPLASEESAPSLSGILVDIQGQGTATFRPVWSFTDPKGDSTRQAKRMLKESKRAGFTRTKLQEQAFLEFMRLNATPGFSTISVSHEANYPTIDEFAARVRNGEKSAVSHYNGSKWQSTSGVFGRNLTERDVTHIAWWSYCTAQMVHPEICHTREDELYIADMVKIGKNRSKIEKEAQNNCAGELTNIAAMLSVLAAGKLPMSEPVLGTVDRPERSARVKSPNLPKHVHQDRLRVISMNVSDQRKIANAYVGFDLDVERSDPKRARQFVNGHLFRARNGAMTWRRPHWRRSEFDDSVATRVT